MHFKKINVERNTYRGVPMNSLFKQMLYAGLSAASLLAMPVQAQEEVWLDVRTIEEYQEAHVAGATHLPYQEVGTRISDLVADKNTVIHVYCRSGNRAGIALSVLHEMGYENAHNDGGLSNLEHDAVIEK